MAASALQWWMDAGADCLIGEAPRDWLSAKHGPPPGTRVGEEPALHMADAATLPGQLGLFQAWLKEDARLPFAAPGAPRMCPEGDPTAGLMMMIDMPSGEDCTAGSLLAGAQGRLFDRMLAAIGRDRTSIYLAALSCLRSPDGRFTTATARQCAVIARHHVGLAAPRALLLFGDACAKALTGAPMTQARGRWHDVDTPAGPVRALVTFPPSFLLRQPAAKALAWADLQMLMEGLKS